MSSSIILKTYLQAVALKKEKPAVYCCCIQQFYILGCNEHLGAARRAFNYLGLLLTESESDATDNICNFLTFMPTLCSDWSGA